MLFMRPPVRQVSVSFLNDRPRLLLDWHFVIVEKPRQRSQGIVAFDALRDPPIRFAAPALRLKR